MKQNIKHKTSTGFTLIEVLVSLTILTIVLGVVYSSFSSVQRALSRFDKVAVKYHETRTALDMMRREVEGTLFVESPYAAIEDSEEPSESVQKPAAITGLVMKDRDILGFKTSYLSMTSFSFKRGGLNSVKYYVHKESDKLHLLKSEAPAALADNEYEVAIIEDIKSFKVETQYNDKWVSTWDTKDTGMLPEVLRLSIEFDDNGRTVNLTEYARPMFATEL